MGFFSEFKEQLATGGNIVTKTVEGKVSDIGRLKIQTIDEMEAQGYMLVNEEKEDGYAQKFYGTVAMARYTLTFKKTQAAKQREAEEEQRAIEEERKKKEESEREWQQAFDGAEEIINSLGHGYCVLIENVTGKEINGIIGFFDRESSKKRYKKALSMTGKILKKCGKLSVLSDCGEKACNNLCNKLEKFGLNAKVAAYDEKLYSTQENMYYKVGPYMDIFVEYLSFCAYSTMDDRSYGYKDYTHPFIEMLSK